MIALVLAALTLPMAPAAAPIERAAFQPSGAVARAEVRIRIISGASITLGQAGDDVAARLRLATVRIDGEARQARLIEFQ